MMICRKSTSGCATTKREMEAALALLQLHSQAPFRAQLEMPLPKTSVEFDMDVEDTATAALYLMRLFEPVKKTATERTPKPKQEISSKVTKHRILKSRNVNTINHDMVPIGCGYAKIPSRLLKTIRWTPDTYTSATRKLLTAVFSRSVLATHSLTGKPSPAFPNKPAKKKLNELIINDIVHTVVMKCGVAANLVRTSITTKCADESKMHRTRQNKKSKRKNLENRSPSSESDEE